MNYLKEIIYEKCEICRLKFRKMCFSHILCSDKCRKEKYHIKYETLKKSKLLIISCYNCGTTFETTIKNKKFCSLNCKLKANNHKIRERQWVGVNIKEIRKILPQLCKCGMEANEIHHKTYKIPIRKVNKENPKYYEAIIKYCKYLDSLCTWCHRDLHKNLK